MDAADVVVVGGGIGGSSLAYALASNGLGVTVLEASTEFPDRVRGESMHTWGVKEARELGVESILMDAGAHVAPLWKQFSHETEEPTDFPMSIMTPGIDGTLNLRHPDACQALIDAAEKAGASVVRGVQDVKLARGSTTTVSYRNGTEASIETGLVVGADGHASTVRKQVGVTLEQEAAIGYISGLLLEGLTDVPEDFDVMVGEDDLFFILFHQGGGRARAYICTGLSGQHDFAGRNSAQKFLDACRFSSYPWAEQVASATPAGPCATYPGTDSWTPTPFAEGAVLIGDAAGHNDPIIGEGLSIAMRDARSVRDLVLDGARGPDGFAPYGDERVERMRRLRLIANIIGVTQIEDGADNRAARRSWVGERMGVMDPELFPLLFGAFGGPETIPDEVVDDALLDRIRAA